MNLACEHIGIVRTRTDPFFEGTLGRSLAKIVPFTHPLTVADLEQIKRELSSRPEEERDVTVVCLGKELAADAWLEEWNRLRRRTGLPNQIAVIEPRTERLAAYACPSTRRRRAYRNSWSVGRSPARRHK